MLRRLLFVSFVTILFSAGMSQAQSSRKITGTSSPGKLDIMFKPPELETGVDFSEPSGNVFLDAEEKGEITIKVTNSGGGIAKGVSIEISGDESEKYIKLKRHEDIGDIAARESKSVVIGIAADEFVSSGEHRYTIRVKEKNGFDADPVSVVIESRAFVPPELALADVGIDDDREGDSNGNNDGVWDPKELVEVTLVVQNKGKGKAEHVTLTIDADNENIFCQADPIYDLGDMPPGAWKKVTFPVSVSMRYDGPSHLPIYANIKEKHARFSASHIDLGLTLNERSKRSNEIAFRGKESLPAAAVSTFNAPPRLSSDVDNPIKTNMKNNDGIAVVIGVSDYKALPNVNYARRDATSIRNYLINTLGYREGNIMFLTDEDVTKSNLQKVFEGKLHDIAKPGKSDIFVFYAGHGAPDIETQKPYLVPYECDDVNYISIVGFPLEEVYREVADCKPRSAVFVIDACFSGGSPVGSLFKGISPATIKVNEPALLMDNAALFSSSQENEVSTWYDEQKHGLFTYYFLKGLRGNADENGDKKITAKEMKNYLIKSVPYRARALKHIKQNPYITIKDPNYVIVKYSGR